MARTCCVISLILSGLLCGVCFAADGQITPQEKQRGWVSIFDGKSLAGWHVSSKTGHGTGGKWMVENGAITGTQDKPGNGGIIVTDAAYGDFEVALEMNNDYGPDSGLFLRSTEDGRCYQAMIDYHNDGNLMGVYGEGIGGFVSRNFIMLASPDQIKIADCPSMPCPFTPEQWKSIWKKGWNDLRARIQGNPPTIETWINGVKTMQWTDMEKRLDNKGAIGLQVHGGGNLVGQFVRYRNIRVRTIAPDNTLSTEEKAAGWQLLFDGRTFKGWMTSSQKPSQVPLEFGCIQPHRCGGYLMIHEKPWGNFILSVDYAISKGCNSGVFIRTFPLTTKPGRSLGYNGLEMQILDSAGSGMHDSGALYDLVPPKRNAMKPVGQWNHAVITADKNLITIEVNGEVVTKMDLDEWTQSAKRPDGTPHKFPQAFKEHPRTGYIGFQDHGSKCWFKNVKLMPLP